MWPQPHSDLLQKASTATRVNIHLLLVCHQEEKMVRGKEATALICGHSLTVICSRKLRLQLVSTFTCCSFATKRKRWSEEKKPLC
ncbi:hypothetical protein ACOMHN_052774 [Nucella lapillus]